MDTSAEVAPVYVIPFNVVVPTSTFILSNVEDNESAVLSATVYDENGDVISGKTVSFYINDELYDTAITDNTGVATVSYSSQGAGDLYIKAKNNDMFSVETYIEDIYYYDDATIDKSNNYDTTYINNATLTYDSSSNVYSISGFKQDYMSRLGLLNNNSNDIEFELDFKIIRPNQYAYQTNIGIDLFNSDKTLGIGGCIVYYGGGRQLETGYRNKFNSYSDVNINVIEEKNPSFECDIWYHMKVKLTSELIYTELTNVDNINSTNTILNDLNNTLLYLSFYLTDNTSVQFKNIKIKKL